MERDAAAWMLTDSAVGWQDRANAAELLREEHAAREAAEAAAARSRYELERLRGRRSVRIVNELSAVRTAGLRGLPTRLREAGRPVEEPAPPQLPETPAPVPKGVDRPKPSKRVPYPHPHLRVAHLGTTARFAQLAPHHVLRPDTWRERLVAGADLLLLEVGPADQLPPVATEAADEARAAGIPVVVIAHEPPAGLAARADLVLVERPAGGTSEVLRPSVELATFNPTGWQPVPPDPLVAVVTSPSPDRDVLRALQQLDPPLQIVRGPDVPDDAFPDDVRVGSRFTDPRGLARSLKRVGVLVDHVGLHADAAAAHHLRLAAAACGTVTLAADGVAGAGALPLDTVADATEAAHRWLIDRDARERHSITTRRQVLSDDSHDARFRQLLAVLDLPAGPPPLVTALLSTNRPEMVEQGLRSVAIQRGVDRETVLVLHGFGDGDGFEVPRVDGLGELTVIRVPAARPLGDALNAGIDRARGTHIAKFDDDDHYGPDHLADLVLAQRYSGAPLVGKRIDFVHLAERDLTIRRGTSTPERRRSRVSGATILLTAEAARRYRFLRLSRRLDSTLCERMRDDGAQIYVTHSRDIVMQRHSGGHTWDVDEGELAAEADDERPGRDLAWAASAPLEPVVT